MLTIYTHLVGSLHVAAPHTYCWTTPPRYTRRSWRDRVFRHEIRSRVAQPPLSQKHTYVEERDTELCSLFMRIWSIHCVWLLHTHCWITLPRYTRRLWRDCVLSHEIRSRVAQLPLSQNTDYRELCSALFTQIWSVHCVWRLHTLGIITKHLDLDADPIG